MEFFQSNLHCSPSFSLPEGHLQLNRQFSGCTLPQAHPFEVLVPLSYTLPGTTECPPPVLWIVQGRYCKKLHTPCERGFSLPKGVASMFRMNGSFPFPKFFQSSHFLFCSYLLQHIIHSLGLYQEIQIALTSWLPLQFTIAIAQFEHDELQG